MYIIEQEFTMASILETSEAQQYPTWVASKEYKYKEMVTYEGVTYMSVVSKNRGVNPTLNSGKWLRIDVDNFFAAFDQHTATRSVGTKVVGGETHLTYTLDVSSINMIAMTDIFGETIHLTQLDASGGVLKDEHHGVGAARLCANNWYNYYFCAIPTQGAGQTQDMFIESISPSTAKLKIDIMSTTDAPHVALIAGGAAVDIGEAVYDVSTSLIDDGYRKKEKQSGQIEIIREEVRDVMTVKLANPAKRTRHVKREIKKRMNKIMLFIADPAVDTHYEHLIEWGFIRSFDTKITNQVFSTSYITIEEII